MNILISKALTGLTLAATMSLASGVTTLANADPGPEGASNSSFTTSRVDYLYSKPGNGFIHRSHGTQQIASDTSPWRITAGSLRTSGYRKPGNGIIHRGGNIQQAEGC